MNSSGQKSGNRSRDEEDPNTLKNSDSNIPNSWNKDSENVAEWILESKINPNPEEEKTSLRNHEPKAKIVDTGYFWL